MSDNTSNNKRIAKNTIMLYFRMIFIMAVNLYASRVVLDVLGASDYGTYNVVGGIVTMLSFISATMSGSTSRFITFELGKQNGDPERMFRIANTIFYIFAISAFILAETVGLWFLQTKINIPVGRETAAFWVYQFSVLSFVISLLSVSYNALIIAKEKMNAFAYISIYDGLARLGILYFIAVVPVDKLILYAGLLTIIQLSIRVIYTIYCKRNFSESNGRWLWDGKVSKEIFAYAGWSLGGHLAIVGYTQGINILLNIYFGPVVNAARAIATQVQSALAQFYANFQTAIRPQVIKNYAQGNMDYMHSLVLRTGRISCMLSIIVTVPFVAFAEYVLNLWLVNPPEHVVAFVRLTMIAGISNSLSQHTMMAIHAVGDIKKFQIVEAICLLTILPISWVLLKFFHVPSEVVILVYALVEVFTLFVRVYLSYPRIGLQIKFFYRKVFAPSIITLCLCSIPAFVMYKYFYPSNFITFTGLTVVLVAIECIAIFFVGLEQSERSFIISKIRKY